MNTRPLLQVKHLQLAQDSIWLYIMYKSSDNSGPQQRLHNSPFCSGAPDFEVDEDSLGSTYTPTSICLFVYT